jgi:hypothetical protein
VDSVPDPLLLRKYGSAGNRTRTSGSVDHTGGRSDIVPNMGGEEHIGVTGHSSSGKN